MANVEHSTLTTTNLHENKGVAAATDNTVATAVTGATVWAKLTAASLTGTGNSFGSQLLHVRDEKPSGTAGGGFSSGSYRTRTLNTTKTSEIAGSSFSSNQITLPAGTYDCLAWAPANFVNSHRLKLRNITDGSDLIIGNGAKCSSNEVHAFLTGRFTLSGAKVLELQHFCTNTTPTDGFGTAVSSGDVEVYAEIKIWKVL